MFNFEYFRPSSLEEAVTVLRQQGPGARILAGGTELLVNIRQGAASPSAVVSLQDISDLHTVTRNSQGDLIIGAAVPLHDIERHPEVSAGWKVLAEAARDVASLQIRNMGTVGGNICQDRKCVYYNQSHINLFMRESQRPCYAKGGSICHAAGKDSVYHSLVGARRCWASCCSDMLVALVCCEAQVSVSGALGMRQVAAENFWPGPEAGIKALDPGEIVTSVLVPKLADGTRSTYLKYRRDARDFPIISVAARVKADAEGVVEDARLVIGGVAPVPLRLNEVEEALKGSKLTDEAIEAVGDKVLADARTRGPWTEFKLVKTRSLVKNALRALKG